MKQFKAQLRSIATGKDAWENVHANSQQEAYDKIFVKHGYGIEVIRIIKHGRKNN